MLSVYTSGYTKGQLSQIDFFLSLCHKNRLQKIK